MEKEAATKCSTGVAKFQACEKRIQMPPVKSRFELVESPINGAECAPEVQLKSGARCAPKGVAI